MPKILVVDDEQSIQEMLREILEASGHQVWMASNGIEGLECLKQIHPDIALLDICMPEMDGLSVLETINRSGCSIRVLLMSASVSTEKINRGLKFGAFAFIKKPFNISILLEAVKAALDAKPDKNVIKYKKYSLQPSCG